MALTVIVRSGEPGTPPSITFDAPRIVIGRGEGCEVRLPDPSVSHRHASIRQRGTDYVVLDEGSSNGTFVGPVRLSPQAPRMVRSGDLVRVGRVWLELRIEQVPITLGQKFATRDLALQLVAQALAAQGAPAVARVFVKKGPDTGSELLLDESERRRVVGRGAGVDWSLEDPDLSRRQVEIHRRGSELFVKDLGSKNGSYLNGQRLEAGKDTVWPIDVALGIGQTELGYVDPVRDALEHLETTADERMRDDDSVDPPGAVQAPVSEAPVVSSGVDPERPNPARLEPAPRKGAAPARQGLRLLDLVVLVIGVSVLSLSLIGLWMLFR